MNEEVVHDISKQTEIETEEGNDKIIRENIELRMKFIESDNKISRQTEELMKFKLENQDFETQLNDIAMAFIATDGIQFLGLKDNCVSLVAECCECASIFLSF